ncbi:MalM family protein [Parvibaculum sedimenti]|nr:MalM family protein [Parvibaculum sedimenti]
MKSLRWEVPIAMAAIVAAGLGGCAKDKVSQPPILSLPTASVCTAAPELTRALPLVFDPEKDLPVTVSLDAGSACLEQKPGERSLYGVVALPAAGQQLVISVASEPIGQSIFAPQLMLLDQKGAVLRRIPRDDFMFRGGALTALIRAHDAERYLVVISDPKMVGQNISQVAGATTATPVTNGIVGFVAYTGSESTTNLTYSHGGTVKVVAQTLGAGK